MQQKVSGRPQILYVDDEKENLTNFRYLFRTTYEVHLAQSAEEGYGILRQRDIHVVIADQKMPGETGVQFLENIVSTYPDAIRIILTGYCDIDAVIHAINRSKIYYYLQKPWDEKEMRLVLDNALELYRSRRECNQLLAGLNLTAGSLDRGDNRLPLQVSEKTRLVEEIRSSKEQLQISEERLRAIFEAAQDCIFVKDESLRYTHLNPSMLNLLGTDPHNVIGQTDEHFLNKNLVHNLRSMESRVLEGQSIESEYSMEIGGESVVLSATRMPVRDASGKIVGLCGILRDVTERKDVVSSEKPDDHGYISESMNATLKQVLLAADSDSTVLFLGESGSGKDFLARYLHDHSHRSGGPFFAINCAALAPQLVESELFGHEPGSFTGSRGRKRGLVELAEGGTLLLNEVGELALPIQAKLLTFLDTRQLTRVGGEKALAVNARIVGATNRDLRREMESGGFREDLFYRLNVFPVTVPPLRARIDDLSVLVPEILSRLSARFGLSTIPSVEPDAMEMLADYHWPGNVRELENILERALILSPHGPLCRSVLLLPQDKTAYASNAAYKDLFSDFSHSFTLHDAMNRTKQHLISQGLKKSGGNITRAASLLGISRGSLRHYMRRLNIPKGSDT